MTVEEIMEVTQLGIDTGLKGKVHSIYKQRMYYENNKDMARDFKVKHNLVVAYIALVYEKNPLNRLYHDRT